MVDGEFTKEIFDSIAMTCYEQMTRNKQSVSYPKAFVLGGQPGAGKTGLQKIMTELCNNNLIVINADEFREFHPDFQRLQCKYGKNSVDYTGKFSGQMTETLISMLKSKNYNVLVEGTLRTAQVPLETCDRFKDKGYEVTLAVMAVKPEISYISTILRYEAMCAEGKTPRATSKEAHENVVNRLPDNLKKIYDSRKFDNIVIYNRSGECLYDLSKNPNARPEEIITEIFYGKWNQNELNQFFEIGKCTYEFMLKRNAEEIGNFKTDVFNQKILQSIAQKNNLIISEEMQKFFFMQNLFDAKVINPYYIENINQEQAALVSKSGIPAGYNSKVGIIVVNKEDADKVKALLGCEKRDNIKR